MNYLQLTAGWVVVVFMAGLSVLILFRILQGGPKGIDLKYLVSEENGQASLSRFQFLIFTYVIAMGLLVIILKCEGFPQINGDILALLGISGGSYVASKITQKAAGPTNPEPGGQGPANQGATDQGPANQGDQTQ